MAQQPQPRAQTLPIKMYRSDDRLSIATPMPGLQPENIRVEVTERSIVLLGDLRGAPKGENELIVDEWNPGPYRREIELPTAVDGEMANVTYNNGVVVIALPLAAQTRPAQITLGTVTATHGERVGNFGHPVRAGNRGRR